MTCFTCEQNLSAYIDDELGVANRREVESHLAGCDRCRAEYEHHVGAWEAATDRPAVSAPDGLWDGVEAAIGPRGAAGTTLDDLALIVRGLAQDVRDLRREVADLRRDAGAPAHAADEESLVRRRIRARPELSIWTEPGVGRRRAEAG